jgi:uncharacterized membrane protein YidH (DUF202 family)
MAGQLTGVIMQETVHTPGVYADLSHAIAVVTVLLAAGAAWRLRPALHARMRRGQRSRATLPALFRVTAIAVALACLLLSGRAQPAVKSHYLSLFRRQS